MLNEVQDFFDDLFAVWDRLEVSDDEIAQSAYQFLGALAGRRSDSDLPVPFRNTVQTIYDEISNAPESRKEALQEARRLLGIGADDQELAPVLWKLFFPEALHLDDDMDKQIPLLRNLRTVSIQEPAAAPIQSPVNEILFTSNILLSPPTAPTEDLSNDPRGAIIEEAASTRSEPQRYWYDHPVPVGIPVENDEVVYGLGGLADALNFEKNRGTAGPEDRMTVCLSVSVTHEGLQKYAKPWLKAQLGSLENHRFAGMDVYAFSENDAATVVDILKPWLSDADDEEILFETFGVDGEYGRHYSFLKAMPALWSILEDERIRATFKIDLDQVFPQEILAAETGKSAFEHFCTPLWGAKAKDAEGNAVELGMIAGALVNEKDIAAGLFTPDIPWPVGLPEGEDLFFFKQGPMAVSTRAELMTRYGVDEIHDGETTALHRIHVTGGTNGILLDALRRHRPFTPSFIGRAEDQGYLLSVIHADTPEKLRYAHASGLIMRHDKEAFAGAAVKAGKSGSYVGDLVRMFVFSAYAKILPGGTEEIKKIVDPFTGCFITPMPTTLALLRLALHLLSGGSTEARKEILNLAARRLPEWIEDFDGRIQWIEKAWKRERDGWNIYYDALDRLEKALANGDALAKESAERFQHLVTSCKISS